MLTAASTGDFTLRGAARGRFIRLSSDNLNKHSTSNKLYGGVHNSEDRNSRTVPSPY